MSERGGVLRSKDFLAYTIFERYKVKHWDGVWSLESAVKHTCLNLVGIISLMAER